MEAATTTKTDATKSKVGVFARFSAKWIPPLFALLEMRKGDFIRAVPGIQIEPHPDGGAMLIATDGRMSAHIHDRTGIASGIIVLDVCKRMAKACTPPEMPFGVLEGEAIPLPPPPYAVAGDVLVTADGDGHPGSRWQTSPRSKGFSFVHVSAKAALPDDTSGDGPMPLYSAGGHIHGETTAIDRKPIPWQSIVPTGEPCGAEVVGLPADHLALLELFGFDAVLTFYGPAKPVLVTFRDEPDVKILVMPMKSDRPVAPTED